MTARLVFIHGRSQENKNPADLKKEWMSAWARGLSKSGLEIPIEDGDVRFPYYGQTLFGLAADVPGDQVADIIVRGERDDSEQVAFLHSALDQARVKAKINDDQLAELTDDVTYRGPLNWKPIQYILKAIDRYVPGGSGGGVALATNDVYQYLVNPGIRDEIEMGVRAAMSPGVPTVVVAHSLGTVVAYNLLRRDGAAMGWNVPLFVTVGCPLAVTVIKQALRPIRAPACVGRWYNALDTRDVVALYPLDANNFKIDPPIVNYTSVDNSTTNRHGISGYLDDKEVAGTIYEALAETRVRMHFSA